MDRADAATAIAFGIAVVGGGFAQLLLRRSFQVVDRDDAPTLRDLAPAVGHVERALYLGALLAGQAIFVGVWLTLKTLGSADILARAYGKSLDHDNPDDSKAKEIRLRERRIYQRFLVMSGVSLAWAAGAWKIQEAIRDHHDHHAEAILAGLVVGSLLLWFVIPGAAPRAAAAFAAWRKKDRRDRWTGWWTTWWRTD